MQVQPEHIHHGFTVYHLVASLFVGGGTWEAVRRTLKKFFQVVIENMPPLPADATWMQRLWYGVLRSYGTPGRTFVAPTP